MHCSNIKSFFSNFMIAALRNLCDFQQITERYCMEHLTRLIDYFMRQTINFWPKLALLLKHTKYFFPRVTFHVFNCFACICSSQMCLPLNFSQTLLSGISQCVMLDLKSWIVKNICESCYKGILWKTSFCAMWHHCYKSIWLHHITPHYYEARNQNVSYDKRN